MPAGSADCSSATAATAATAGGCTATAVPEAAPCKVSATVV
ncbi:PE family protein, partial [Mycobacterium tuberculosis]